MASRTQPEVSHNPIACQSGNSVNFHGDFSPAARRALSAWSRAKESLRKPFSPRDFSAVIRPVYLIGVLSEKFFLLSMPRNKRVAERLQLLKPVLRQAIQAQGYELAGLTWYPSDEHLLMFKDHPSLGPFFNFIFEKRVRRAFERTMQENSRDRGLLKQFQAGGE